MQVKLIEESYSTSNKPRSGYFPHYAANKHITGKGLYDGKELQVNTTRKGSQDFMKIKSKGYAC